MASYPGHGQVEPAKMEQIITEFFAKTLHIILESRCPFVSSRNYSGEQIVSSPASSSSSSSSIRQRDKWFNLALRECPAALENIDFWRQGNLEPMVIDVVLVQRSSDWDPVSCSPQRRGLVKNLSLKERFPEFLNSDSDEFGCEARTEKIIERWVVQYETRKSGRDCVSGSKRSISPSSQALYKKSILLLRSLYTMVRLLPAYKLFRDLNSSGQILAYNLAHRVSSFAEPFTRQEDSEMQHFMFTPVDTLCGRLCLSVLYRSSLLDVGSEPSTPMTPQLIADYVGSPLAEPLKRFPSAPQGFQSPNPFSRRHSWSHDLYGISPPSALPSPSPTYSDSRASNSKPSCQLPPPSSLPHQFPEIPQPYRRNTNFDDYWPSSPSPSPPAYGPGIHISKALLRSESAPVSIPTSKLVTIPASDNRQNLPPSSPLKGTRVVASKTERSSGLVQTSSTVEKLLSSGKDDIARHSGAKPYSYSSAQKPFSRNSSRRSFDDFDDSEYSGHFDVYEDDDTTDAVSRAESFEQRGSPCDPVDPGGPLPVRKSQDAAVGALVRMLRKAPPLRQDISTSLSSSKASNPAVVASSTEKNETSSSISSSSGHILPKTAADALEELRGFKDIREFLLSKATTPPHI